MEKKKIDLFFAKVDALPTRVPLEFEFIYNKKENCFYFGEKKKKGGSP